MLPEDTTCQIKFDRHCWFILGCARSREELTSSDAISFKLRKHHTRRALLAFLWTAVALHEIFQKNAFNELSGLFLDRNWQHRIYLMFFPLDGTVAANLTIFKAATISLHSVKCFRCSTWAQSNNWFEVCGGMLWTDNGWGGWGGWGRKLTLQKITFLPSRLSSLSERENTSSNERSKVSLVSCCFLVFNLLFQICVWTRCLDSNRPILNPTPWSSLLWQMKHWTRFFDPFYRSNMCHSYQHDSSASTFSSA